MTNQCIFCKSTANSFLSIEHIFPESMGNKEKILPKGMVCDKCNNGILSGLDHELLEFGAIKFLRTTNGIKNKEGKIPVSNFNNVCIENDTGKNIRIKLNSNKNIKNKTNKGFELNFLNNKKLDTTQLKLLARSLYKIVLELMVLDHGKDFVLEEMFDEVRDIVLGKREFNGYLLIGSNEKSENPGMKYQLMKDIETGKKFTVAVFNFLFIRIFFEVRSVIVPCEDKFKIDKSIVFKF